MTLRVLSRLLFLVGLKWTLVHFPQLARSVWAGVKAANNWTETALKRWVSVRFQADSGAVRLWRKK